MDRRDPHPESASLLHALTNVPFDFVLCKHRPYSFELRDELDSMRADRLLERQPQTAPYGPRIVLELERLATACGSRVTIRSRPCVEGG